VVETGEAGFNDLERLGTFANSYDVAHLHSVGRNVDYASVDGNVAVTDELTGSGTRGSDTEAIDNVVETAFKKLEKNYTSNTILALGFVEKITELTLKDTIGVLGFLLLSKHDTILRRLTTLVVAMLTRSIVLLREDLVRSEDRFAELTGDF